MLSNNTDKILDNLKEPVWKSVSNKDCESCKKQIAQGIREGLERESWYDDDKCIGDIFISNDRWQDFWRQRNEDS